ncbi:SusD/RagB family nutrient-binding outer membrane lipoprotein [Sphingobacterium sp. InxBP1]|uniref:SusD/RagB family nutrient-binding outer membrane lipoprotein n=1 Tax=Sphingobacterium sp. InxBP1 TaxID=2870328 RepID=UPI002242EB2B|nr:SusD/RagB family nutrient-binding outer membrane lipoprotein [Sphingobacterium sp. InxBP1]MCW8313478.1 SusD/RagB family nutrient-binding outer membrane lipoprotein [Sphingobacterium sp. InxBP1]
MKIKHISIALLLSAMVGLQGCTKNFDEINTDPNKVENVTPSALITPTVYGMSTYFTVRSNDFTWEIMQTGLANPSAANGVHRYYFTETSGDGTWNTCYRYLRNIREMESAAETSGQAVYKAVATTLKAYIAGLLTDSFGDVPMSEALRAEEHINQPKFDKQEQIYADMIAALETANTLYAGEEAMTGSDLLYNNKKELWRKFNNSLLLRYYLRQSKRIPAAAKIKNILDNPAQYPIFTSNEDAAIVKITGLSPYDYAWGRRQDYVNFTAMAEFFVDNLNTLNDPRRPFIMTEATEMVNGKPVKIGYKGIPAGHSGDLSAYKFNPSTPNGDLMYPEAVGTPIQEILMPYSEVEFIKAEVYLSLGMDAEAQTAYEKGVRASIEQYGGKVPADYFANEAAKFNGTLERIMLQKYLGLFMVDYQQWFEYRRTGYPKLPKTPYMFYNGVMPTRFMYKNEVRRFNPDNYAKAVEQMGGDDFHTKVWWEK